MSAKALQDLFRRHREKATGLWKLGQEPHRTIYFDSGDIVFAQSTHPMDRLTHLLVERGKLTQTQLDYALANLRPGISIGKNLIEMGFITQRDLLEVARAQVERVVSGALATPDLEPVFEAKELDANVVRLPFDTPELLLNGLLGLKDREGLLELLGPLNQVVVLQGRRLMEMNLPADLSKLPPLLDGTHTLLELSRESLAEPLRLGTFALFLREMGWARLHEMPPMDRSALDLALAPEPEPLSPPLPEIETVPSLFSSIQAAAKPTTNLEHLSQAFDAIPEPETLPGPRSDVDESGFAVETGRAILPTPTEVPVVPEPIPGGAPDFAVLTEPAITILPFTVTNPEPSPEPAPPFDEETTGRRKWPIVVFFGLIVAAAVGIFGWNRWRHRNGATSLPPVASVSKPQPKVGEPSSSPSPTSRAGLAVPEPVTEPKPAEKNAEKLAEKNPEKPVEKPSEKPAQPTKAAASKTVHESSPGISIPERLEALRKADVGLAVRQGERLAKELPKGHWTLRLEIACQPETLRRAVEFFEESKPDLWILPLALRDGRGCYQVFYGNYPSRAMADKAIQRLPAAFRTGGNRPKSFQVGEIALKQ